MDYLKLLEQSNIQFLEKQLMETNRYTQNYGLSLSSADVGVLIAEKKHILKAERRVEFGESVLPQIIYAFCDSPYLMQDSYTETLIRLQEIFFFCKNETKDRITDAELIHFMKKQFDETCHGDLKYLESICQEL